jgi:hypothetical protein
MAVRVRPLENDAAATSDAISVSVRVIGRLRAHVE